MGHILHSRPVASDDRLRPASHFRDLTVCRVEWPFTPRCKQALPTAGASLRMSLSRGAAEICRGLKSNEATGLNIPPSPAASLLLSPWDACPYIKMWFGALTGTQWGEAGWEGLGLQCKPQTHSLPPAVLHTQLLVCVVFVYALNVWVDGTHKIPLSFAGSVGWNKTWNILKVQFGHYAN